MDVRHRFSYEREEDRYRQDSSDQDGPKGRKRWQWPGALLAFQLLLFARIVAALTVHITDCDETFNYWEPVSLEGLCSHVAHLNLQ